MVAICERNPVAAEILYLMTHGSPDYYTNGMYNRSLREIEGLLCYAYIRRTVVEAINKLDSLYFLDKVKKPGSENLYKLNYEAIQKALDQLTNTGEKGKKRCHEALTDTKNSPRIVKVDAANWA